MSQDALRLAKRLNAKTNILYINEDSLDCSIHDCVRIQMNAFTKDSSFPNAFISSLLLSYLPHPRRPTWYKRWVPRRLYGLVHPPPPGPPLTASVWQNYMHSHTKRCLLRKHNTRRPKTGGGGAFLSLATTLFEWNSK